MKRLTTTLIALTLILVVASPLAFAATPNTWSIENEDGYEEGYTWGEITGNVLGYKDFANGRDSDWEDAYEDQEEDVEKEFNLEDESTYYRRAFLRGYKDGFEEGYEAGYANTRLEIQEGATGVDFGEDHGAFFGSLDGARAGRADFNLKLISKWERDYPARTDTVLTYRLNYDTRAYQDAFLKSYRINYEKAYLDAFRLTNAQDQNADRTNANDHGTEMGEKQGELHAILDIKLGQFNDSHRALNLYEKEGNLLSRYHLYREAPAYRVHFIEAFRTAFHQAYKDAFQLANLEQEDQNINYQRVTMNEATLTYDDVATNFSGGSASTAVTQPVRLEIPAGTIYGEATFGLTREQNSLGRYTSSYEQVTPVYRVHATSFGSAATLRSPITLRFVFHGDYRAGIYKLEGTRWLYQRTRQGDGYLEMAIPAGAYDGGRYAIFIDSGYPLYTDIQYNWAFDELYTFLRRGFLPGGSSFHPDGAIRRGEFAQILYEMAYAPSVIRTRTFTDENTFGTHADAIYFVASRGYMNGTGTDTFGAGATITYEQMMMIMTNISRDKQTWSTFARDMLYDKFERSAGLSSQKKAITRAETVYMLHELTADGPLPLR